MKFGEYSLLTVMHEVVGVKHAQQDLKHIRSDIVEDGPPKYRRFWPLFLFCQNRLVFDYRNGEPDDIPTRFEKFAPVQSWTVMRFRSKVIFLFRNKNDLVRFRLQCEV